jgi:hypothetical protein
MTLYENFIYGFLISFIFKMIDDIMDDDILYKYSIYFKNYNDIILEFLKLILTIVTTYSLLFYNNYFYYIFMFYYTLVLCVITDLDAFINDSYYFMYSLIFGSFCFYKIIINYNSKLTKLNILLFFIIFIQIFSMYLTEPGIWSHLRKPFKKFFPKLYTYIFLKENVEFSKHKIYLRFINMLFIVYLLLFGNKQIINYFNIDNEEFISVLPIISTFNLAYVLTSVINLSHIIFNKNINIKINNSEYEYKGVFCINLKNDNLKEVKEVKEEKEEKEEELENKVVKEEENKVVKEETNNITNNKL